VDILRMLKPKHTLRSVAETLLAGLADGMIVMEPPYSELFLTLAQELEEKARTLVARGFAPAVSVSAFLGQLCRLQAPFSDLVDTLESLIQLAREFRHTPTLALANDLGWYARLLAGKIELLASSKNSPPVEAQALRQAVSEAVQRGRMLKIALQEQTSIVDELGIAFQLCLAELLKKVLDLEESSIHKQSITLGETMWPSNTAIQYYFADTVRLSFLKASEQRSEDALALVKTLQIALKRAQASIPVQASTAQDRIAP
jgi:hypothetical protein